MTKEIFINENVKGESKEVKYRICDIISAHDGRRTWATINYLKGYAIGLLMQVTGHTKEETFLKYVNASNLQKAKKLKELMNK
ncbi:MAG: site-specific integrase [Saprospiraceae bacterium]|nr:site-specific integrase [Saprospiraceae bacterium]